MNLIEWASNFIDNCNYFWQDLIKKQIIEDKIICEYKDKGVVTYVISEPLNITDIGKVSLVCLNSRVNVLYLVQKWNTFTKIPGLKIIFCNPTENQQWSIIPHIHSKICNLLSLKQGLLSLFESVPEVK